MLKFFYNLHVKLYMGFWVKHFVGFLFVFSMIRNLEAQKSISGSDVKHDEFCTLKAKVDSGVFNVFHLDGRYYFEIPDSLFGRDFLVVNWIVRSSSNLNKQDDFGYRGDKTNECVIRFEKAPNNKINLSRIVFRQRATDSLVGMYKSIVEASMQPIEEVFDIKEFAKSGNGVIIDATTFINEENAILFMGRESRQRLKLGSQFD